MPWNFGLHRHSSSRNARNPGALAGAGALAAPGPLALGGRAAGALAPAVALGACAEPVLEDTFVRDLPAPAGPAAPGSRGARAANVAALTREIEAVPGIGRNLSHRDIKKLAEYIETHHDTWQRQVEGQEVGMTVKKGFLHPWKILVSPNHALGVRLGETVGEGGSKRVEHGVAVVYDAQAHPHAYDAVVGRPKTPNPAALALMSEEGRADLKVNGLQHVVHTFAACPVAGSGGEVSDYMLLQEYCTEGSLVGAIRACDLGRPLFPGERLQMEGDLLLGLKEIHDRGLVHLDIKPDNILLTRGDGRRGLKFADFGFARDFDPQSPPELFAGTPGYMAPEVIRACLAGKAVLRDPKNDVFSLGVVLYLLEHGNLPFFATAEAVADEKRWLCSTVGLDDAEFERHGLPRPPPSDRWTIHALIRAMLSPDPSERPTADEALDWFDGIWRGRR